MDNKMPFNEEWITSTKSIRKFFPDLENEELKWHIDNEDRVIECFHTTDWKFQFDNQLPIPIEGTIKIHKGEWHRLIKGTMILEIYITRTKFV